MEGVSENVAEDESHRCSRNLQWRGQDLSGCWYHARPQVLDCSLYRHAPYTTSENLVVT